METPPIPPPLEILVDRTFSFYPPIINVEYNEWSFRRATWSELLVSNVKTGEDIWIPRHFVGEVSKIEDPVVIVGLNKELEYRGGAIWPHQRRVISMPSAGSERIMPAGSHHETRAPASMASIRLDSRAESRVGRLVLIILAGLVITSLIAVTVVRQGILRPRISYVIKDQSYLELTREDDYYAIVRKLGTPVQDRWRSETGELQYRVLTYPRRSFVVILLGTDRNSARYIGTLDNDWRPVHYIEFARGGSTLPMLRSLHNSKF
jgi:hypothetical protein